MTVFVGFENYSLSHGDVFNTQQIRGARLLHIVMPYVAKYFVDSPFRHHIHSKLRHG